MKNSLSQLQLQTQNGEMYTLTLWRMFGDYTFS